MTAIASIQLDEFIITPSGVEKASIFTFENVLWVVFGLIALFLFLRVCVVPCGYLRNSKKIGT